MNQTHPSIEQLVDYAHGELSAHDDAVIHAHLAECGPCAQAHEAEVRLGELLREHARAEELELPPGLVTSIYARAAADSSSASSWWQRLAASLRPIVAVPVAAALVVAVYFAVASVWLHPTNAKTDAADAAYYMESHAALATTMPFEEGDAIPTVLTSDETDR
jgi:anti-sigma factor RsiW